MWTKSFEARQSLVSWITAIISYMKIRHEETSVRKLDYDFIHLDTVLAR